MENTILDRPTTDIGPQTIGEVLIEEQKHDLHVKKIGKLGIRISDISSKVEDISKQSSSTEEDIGERIFIDENGRAWLTVEQWAEKAGGCHVETIRRRAAGYKVETIGGKGWNVPKLYPEDCESLNKPFIAIKIKDGSHIDENGKVWVTVKLWAEKAGCEPATIRDRAEEYNIETIGRKPILYPEDCETLWGIRKDGSFTDKYGRAWLTAERWAEKTGCHIVTIRRKAEEYEIETIGGKGSRPKLYPEDCESLNKLGDTKSRKIESGNSSSDKDYIKPSYADGGYLKLETREQPENIEADGSDEDQERQIENTLTIKKDRLMVFSKGEAFEQMASLLLSYANPEHTIISQYCLDQDFSYDENGQPVLHKAGCRVDFKLAKIDEHGVQTDQRIYEIKWGQHLPDIDRTIKKQKGLIESKEENEQYRESYHVLCLDPIETEVRGVKLESTDTLLVGINNRDSLDTLESLLVELQAVGEKNGDSSSEDVEYMVLLRDYCYALTENANKHVGGDRRVYLDQQLLGVKSLVENIKDDGENRDELVKYLEDCNKANKDVAHYKPTRATVEVDGKIYDTNINIGEYIKEHPDDTEMSYFFDDKGFHNKLDRDLAVMIILASDEIHQQARHNIAQDGGRIDIDDITSGINENRPIFTVEGVGTISSHPETSPDLLVKNLDDLKSILTFGKYEWGEDIFEAVKESIKLANR